MLGEPRVHLLLSVSRMSSPRLPDDLWFNHLPVSYMYYDILRIFSTIIPLNKYTGAKNKIQDSAEEPNSQAKTRLLDRGIRITLPATLKCSDTKPFFLRQSA